MTPMNQKFTRIIVKGWRSGDAYNHAIELILDHPELSKWKYLLTLEEDNLPPPDGLLKLYESIEDYAVVGGLYWTKGEAGQPMIYGDPTGILNFMPQLPLPTRCRKQRPGDGLQPLPARHLPRPEDSQAVVQDVAGVGSGSGRTATARTSTSTRTHARPATGSPATRASRSATTTTTLTSFGRRVV